MCVDFQELNKIIVKKMYHFPRIDELLDQLKNVVYITKLDLKSGYHHIRIAKNDFWKIDFKTRQGLFEWLVIPFRLYNAPTSFMWVMNHVFNPFIDDFVMVYLDDILIYIFNWKDHIMYVKKVLDVLKREKLCVNMSKSEFGKTSLVYLGYVEGG